MEIMGVLDTTQSSWMELDYGEKRSVLISGGSRIERNFLVSNLIRDGNTLHVIDFGEEWNAEDKTKLMNTRAVEKVVNLEGLRLGFTSAEELSGCAKYIMQALGLRSPEMEAVFKKYLHNRYKESGNCLSIREVVTSLAEDKSENQQEQDAVDMLCDCLNSYGEIPDIAFYVDENCQFSDSSIIWNLSGLDDTYTRITTYLIMYCLYQQKKRDSMGNSGKNRLVVAVNQIHYLDCDSNSIIGVCLADGWKYGLNLMLVTPLLNENFSEAVLKEFVRKCIHFHFRTSAEDAVGISWHLTDDYSAQKEIYQKLVNLSKGEYLFWGLLPIDSAEEQQRSNSTM